MNATRDSHVLVGVADAKVPGTALEGASPQVPRPRLSGTVVTGTVAAAAVAGAATLRPSAPEAPLGRENPEAIEAALGAMGMLARAVVLDAAGDVVAAFGEDAEDLAEVVLCASALGRLVGGAFAMDSIALTELEIGAQTLNIVATRSFIGALQVERRVHVGRAVTELKSLLARLERPA